VPGRNLSQNNIGVDRTVPIPDRKQASRELNSIWRALRKLSDEGAMAVAQVLKEEALVRRDIRERTGVPEAKLNHILIEMQHVNLVLYDKDSKKYHLTNYGDVLLGVIWGLMGSLVKGGPEKYNIGVEEIAMPQ
jgi:hypothetical protein